MGIGTLKGGGGPAGQRVASAEAEASAKGSRADDGPRRHADYAAPTMRQLDKSLADLP
jgi:hypothetical protein